MSPERHHSRRHYISNIRDIVLVSECVSGRKTAAHVREIYHRIPTLAEEDIEKRQRNHIHRIILTIIGQILLVSTRILTPIPAEGSKERDEQVSKRSCRSASRTYTTTCKKYQQNRNHDAEHGQKTYVIVPRVIVRYRCWEP